MKSHLPSDLVRTALGDNSAAIPLRIEQALRESMAGYAAIATNDLELDEYVRLGRAEATVAAEPFSSFTLNWGGLDEDRLQHQFIHAYWNVAWGTHALDVLQVSWSSSCGMETRYWVIAHDQAIAEAFILDVARQTNEPGESVLVFHNGYWERSKEMYLVIEASSMNDLVLPGDRREEMIGDFRRFLQAQSQYEALGLAWRRGAILLGPPGNGKTHFLRALVRELKIPCLYVQSLKHPHYTSEQLLESVFQRARQVRPCVLVFEDLDSLIDEDNRSYFLNQLDGFETNVGLIVVATTNHADRIDAAILDRPSRFDRKYEFSVPAAPERARFLELWKDKIASLVPWEGKSIPSLVAATEGFSFAYLKELMVSGLLQWLHHEQSAGTPCASIEDVLMQQAEVLQHQRRTLSMALPTGHLSTGHLSTGQSDVE
jgi:hypothetical protein